VFFDLHAAQPYLLDVFSASVADGRGHQLHRRLFVVRTDADGSHAVRQPTVFLELAPAPPGTAVPPAERLPSRAAVEQALIEQALTPFLREVAAERGKEIATITRHVEISLDELIHRQQLRHADLTTTFEAAPEVPLNAANLKTSEDRLDELTTRKEQRLRELEREREVAIGDIQFVGRAWVLPHPDRDKPGIAPMVRDEEVERIAVETVTALLRSEGWEVESVETENRGYDLRARRWRTAEPEAVEVRFVEVKGRAGVGEVALTENEYKTAVRLAGDYWLYVVYNCASKPEVHHHRDPARLGWKPVQSVVHYVLSPDKVLAD
jgi:hypothetical protein